MTPAALIAALAARGLTLAVGESCTGGKLSAAFTSVPGASSVFRLGVVAYANEAKVAVLGVPEAEIEVHGAVSREVALSLARGAAAAGSATLGVGVTGIAGPAGGTPEKPVGTVWIAIVHPGGAEARRHDFRGSRSEIQRAARDAALAFLARLIAPPELASPGEPA